MGLAMTGNLEEWRSYAAVADKCLNYDSTWELIKTTQSMRVK